MIRAIIIDDETSAIENLTKIINRFCDYVEVIGSASGVIQGIQVINKLKPDLVFLDIQMPDGTGFNLLECIEDKDFDLIFVTSFNQHAIRAFKYSAVDYILKPIDIDDLVAAIERIKNRKKTDKLTYYSNLFENLSSPIPKKLSVSDIHGNEYILIDDILRFEADGSYTNIYMIDGTKKVASKKIKNYDELLAKRGFLRVHHSHIVNINLVEKYTKSEGGWIYMIDGSEIPLARRKKEVFELVMKKISR